MDRRTKEKGIECKNIEGGGQFPCFCRKSVVTPVMEANDSITGAARTLRFCLPVLTVCGDTIPFHHNAEKSAHKTCGSYIDYIHKTFPYARYSYILNQFVFYQQKALAETYTLEKSNAFSHALVKGNQALKQLISNWFPGVTVHSMMTVEVRCKEYIESTVFSQAKYGRAKLTPKQVEELKTGLGEILGKPISYLNKVLGKLGYELSKRDAKGYYWLTKAGKKPGRTSPGKRRK